MNHLSRCPTSPLAQTEVRVAILDLIARQELDHIFENTSAVPIEAIFSFPMPLDAAFISMEAEIGERRLVGTVMPARRARRSYDDAIAQGDGAVLLEQPEPGLVTVSLGNLEPGQRGRIRLAFATELKVADRIARLSLPFAYRPRYGRQTLEELIQPHHDMALEHSLVLEVTVSGLLAGLPVSCPTHPASFDRASTQQSIRTLKARLDGDFVLNFALGDQLDPIARTTTEQGDVLAYVAAVPPQTESRAQPLEICLLLDGSGSMAGDAIHQTADALREVATGLTSADRIQVLRFGSRVVPILRRPLKASDAVRSALAELAPTLRADLGGTEMGAAVSTALQTLLPDEGASPVIFLVTDGAVTRAEAEPAIEQASKAGVRIFVVAVGSSAGVDILEPMATRTGGALERAVPGESVADGLMRQLRRARSTRAPDPSVTWSPAALRSSFVKPSYAGDMFSQFVHLPDCTSASVRVSIEGESGEHSIELADAPADGSIKAILGRRLYDSADAQSREAIALKYGLLTADTSVVLVDQRDAKDATARLPQVVPIDHMVPRGFGAGFVAACAPMSLQSFDATCYEPQVADFGGDCYLDIPAFLRRRVDDEAAGRTTRLRTVRASQQSIARDVVDRIVEQLFSVLRDLVFTHATAPSVRDAISCIDEGLQASAVRIAGELGFTELERRGSGIDLLLILAEERAYSFNDDEEARLATLVGWGTATGYDLVEQTELLRLLRSEGLHEA